MAAIEDEVRTGPAENLDFTENDWLSDAAAHFSDQRPAPKRSDEFTRLDWQNYRSMTVQQAQRELDKLLADNKIARRVGLHDGHKLWLYTFVKSNS